MAKLSKRMRVIREKVDGTKEYSINEAIALLKELATAKFVESVDVAVNLGIDARKSDQNVRGATVLPHGTGREVRVAVFTQGANAEAAKAAGAELVGMDELADLVKKGEMNFDVVIASPDAMRVVGQLGQILGPRGLMPNPKVGTVTPNVAEAVKSLKLAVPTASELAAHVETLRRQKYDHLIPDGLLRDAFARSRISTEGLMAALDTLSF